MVRGIKANASRWIHQTFPSQKSFAWQSGYGAFTVSESQVQNVRRYIQTQEIHHRRTTFEDEFIALLRAHGVSFDQNNIWTEEAALRHMRVASPPLGSCYRRWIHSPGSFPASRDSTRGCTPSPHTGLKRKNAKPVWQSIAEVLSKKFC